MTLPWDLEEWLTETGDRVVRKRATQGEAALTPSENLLYETWLLDIETRNGGIPQYFANRGIKQWQQCITLASAWPVPSFSPFAMLLTDSLKGDSDPYQVPGKNEVQANDLCYTYQTPIVTELRKAVEPEN